MHHVALLGKAQSGKDTVAGLLTRHASYTRLAFADKLKEAALRVNPWIPTCEEDPYSYGRERLADLVESEGWESAKDYPEVRRFLQEYGQAMRSVDPEIWIRPVMRSLRLHELEGIPCVVTDVRYSNEVAALQDRHAKIVRVERAGAGLSGENAAHDSETELDSVQADVWIGNHGSLNDLADVLRRDLIPLLSGVSAC